MIAGRGWRPSTGAQTHAADRNCESTFASDISLVTECPTRRFEVCAESRARSYVRRILLGPRSRFTTPRACGIPKSRLPPVRSDVEKTERGHAFIRLRIESSHLDEFGPGAQSFRCRCGAGAEFIEATRGRRIIRLTTDGQSDVCQGGSQRARINVSQWWFRRLRTGAVRLKNAESSANFR